MAMTEEESSSDPPKEGWVPANHLEKLVSGITMSLIRLLLECG